MPGPPPDDPKWLEKGLLRENFKPDTSVKAKPREFPWGAGPLHKEPVWPTQITTDAETSDPDTEPG